MAGRIRFALLVLATSAAVFAARPVAARHGSAQARTAAADGASTAFWSASSSDEAARLTEPIVRAGVTFEDVYRRLQRGRHYAARDTGVVRMENRTSDGV